MNERLFVLVLRAAGVFILGAGAMHVCLGLQADALLGAGVSTHSLSDPGLDSQNRFYGATFVLYGVLLFLVTRDLERYAPVLRSLLWVFWFAGLVRFISVVLFGWPPVLILALFVVELTLPPLMLLWQSRLTSHSQAAGPQTL